MIRYFFDPNTQEHELKVDLVDAFKDSKEMTDFLINAGLEVQTAILAIIARIYHTVDYICSDGKGMNRKNRDMIKEIMIQTACQDTTVDTLNEFMNGTNNP